MSSLNDPTTKMKYQKCKLRVKRWESDFMERHGRKPKKNDIRSADVSIKEAYKMYWNLKTQALEETLLDITFSDDIATNVSVNQSFDNSLLSENIGNIVNNSVNITPSKNIKNIVDTHVSSTSPRNIGNINQSVSATPPKNIENIVPRVSPLKNNSVINSPPEQNLINVDGAWGSHLNKDKFTTKSKKKLPIGKSPSFQLCQNKFTSSTFAKRNPRKSLSTSRLKIKLNSNNSRTQNQDVNDIQCDEVKHDIQSFLSESVKITQQVMKVTPQPINPIQELVNSGPIVVERNINTGWLDRCSKENNLESVTPSQQRLSGVSDSGIESIDLSDHTPPGSIQISKPKTSEISDDEDFVCISDTEEESRNKRMRNWRKTLSETIGQPTKRLCTENSNEKISSPLSNHLSSDMKSVFSNTKDNYVSEIVKDIQETESVLVETKKDENVETSIDPTASKNTKYAAIKKAQIRKSKVDDFDDEIEKPKTRKLRVARATLATINAQPKNKSSVTRCQKGTLNERITRRNKRKNVSSEDEKDISPETLDNPDIPIYGVESLDVVPRFSVPTETTGDLINDLCQSAVVNKMAIITNKTASKPKNAMTPKEKLEAKVAAGKVNENFVRINLKKKVFARGKKSFNYSRYKKNEWKQKKKGLESSEGSLDLADLAEKNVCFKCGDSGHMGKKCPALNSDELLPLDENEPFDFPTLQEAEKMASQEAKLTHSHQIDKISVCPSLTNSTVENFVLENEDIETYDVVDFDEKYVEKKSTRIVGQKIPQDLVDKLLPPINGKIDPLYSITPDGSTMKTPEEVFEVLKMFGYTGFRPGQEQAIMRILNGQSTLVTLSTGSGKSLCYQLPAYLYAKRSRCITLVVSPLVSLMDDQVTGIPKFISAAALHTGQTPKVREKIIENVKEGKLDILLISPEAIVAGEKSTGFGALLRQLPPIAFVCIDEAHCISQWSHNFRPSYLMICRILMEKMGVKTILGLTATATRNTADSIVNHLRIPDGMNGVISDIPLPTNLTLTVSKDEQRDRALINLLNSKRFENCDSVIIYCTRREECTRIAGLLRVSLQDTVNITKSQSKNKVKVSPIAEAYHAGLVASRRKTIQKAFMNGDTRIVVATVAFGMGINKPNIRSVIHYNMPSNFEGYVQEIGRAGRDNLPAQCHLFLSPKEDSDKWELRRHIYADCVDRHTIRRLLQKVFVSCSCAENGRKCPGHEVAIPIDETVRLLDVSEETILTLLCYLELHPKKFITVLSSVYVNAKISSYNGPKALKAAAQSSPPLAMAIALDVKKGNDHENSSVIEFNVIDVAAAIGWDSGVVKSHLKNLEWDKSEDKYKRTSISVRYDTLGLRVRAPGDLTDAELDEALDALSERSKVQQTSALQQLAAIHASLNKYSHTSVRDCMDLNEASVEKSENLKNTIRQYFQLTSPLSIIDIPPEICNKSNEDQIINDIRALICSYRDNNFTGRAVARIFHGIQSPNYSALTWSRCRFWRAHLSVDFNWIVQIATREILSMR